MEDSQMSAGDNESKPPATGSIPTTEPEPSSSNPSTSASASGQKVTADSITSIPPPSSSLGQETSPKKFALPLSMINKGPVQPMQVETARPLFAGLWRKPDHIHFLGKLDPRTRHFSNVPVLDGLKVVELVTRLCGERSDVYFACAEFLTNESRTQANAVGAFGFWGDIDCGEQKAAQGKGYATIELALAAVESFCTATGIPKPNFTVNSGGGIHIHWVMTNYVLKEHWQAYAKKLKALAAKFGFLADPTRTADIASVMRIPGTLNRKYDPPKPVTLLHFSKDFIANSLMFDAIEGAYEKFCEVLAATPKSKGHPRTPTLPNVEPAESKDIGRKLAQMEIMLTALGSNLGYEDWCNGLMAIHHESGGSEQGLDLADRWSSTGIKYPGRHDIEMKWRSFQHGSATPITIGTLNKMLADAGIDRLELLAAAEPDFGPSYVEVEVVHPKVTPPSKPAQQKQPRQPAHPLAKYSLLGHTDELEKRMVEQKPLLGGIALFGQATAIYAKPNTGKTLLALSQIVLGIGLGHIDPAKLFYINMDDNSQGLVDKNRLADEYGFHMLADGYQGFEAKDFPIAMAKMIDTDSASGVVVVLDTLRSFVDTMRKTESSNFAGLVRRFVMKGGSVVALSHTNKNPGQDGKPVYAGVADIVNQFDCAFTLAEVTVQPDTNERVVEFTNFKRRGDVALTAAYAYAFERSIPYNELLLSVREVDPEQLEPLKKAVALVADEVVMTAIEASIKGGINTKMRLAEAVAKAASISQRNALQMIEKYTGNNPDKHRWFFEVRERGAKVYVLLGEVVKPPDYPAVPTP